MDLEVIRARLVADSAGFVAGMARAQSAIGGLQGASASSGRAMTALRTGLVGLASQATGVTGPMGKVVQALLQFGGGGMLVLGVAAGIGAIAFAYRALTKDTRDAEQAQKDMVKTLQGMGAHGQLVGAQSELASFQAEFATRMQRHRQMVAAGMIAGGGLDPETQRLSTRIAEIQNRIFLLTRETAKWQRGIADDAYNAWRAETGRVAALKEGLGALQRQKALLETPGFMKGTTPESTLKAKGFQTPQEFLPELDTLQKQIFETVGDAQMLTDLHDLGVSMGRQVMMGIIEGLESMEDILKRIFLGIMDFAIGAILNAIIPGAGLAGSVAKNIGGVEKMTAAPMNVTMNMGGIQPLTAFFVARDPAFQALLREGTLVSRAAGFR